MAKMQEIIPIVTETVRYRRGSGGERRGANTARIRAISLAPLEKGGI
jgi:hypothetical protein